MSIWKLIYVDLTSGKTKIENMMIPEKEVNVDPIRCAMSWCRMMGFEFVYLKNMI